MAVTVTPALVAGALTNFRRGFDAAFAAALNLQPWREIATEVQSTSDTETHLGLGTVPTMVDVTHDVLQVESLYAFDLTIPNLTYKAAFEVPRTYFEDEKLGLVRPKIAELAEEAARHPGQLLFQIVVNNSTAFDGTALIADTRTIGRSANIDNQIAGGSDPTVVANFQAQLAAARGQMRAFQDDQGRPMNKPGNVIMVPPGLEQVAFQALNAQMTPLNQPVVPSTDSGAFSASGYFVIVNPYLTDANDWYLIYARNGATPFIYQTRTAPTLEPLTDGSHTAVVNDKFIYTVRARYAVAAGDPRLIVRVTNT
jgi:phage major head subunit gpT-like protein